MNIKKELTSLRAKHQFSQSELAELLDLSEQSYRNKENEKTDFTATEMKKLYELFGQVILMIFFNYKVYDEETYKNKVS